MTRDSKQEHIKDKDMSPEKRQASSSDLCGCLVIDPCGCYTDPCGCYGIEEVGCCDTSCGCINFR